MHAVAESLVTFIEERLAELERAVHDVEETIRDNGEAAEIAHALGDLIVMAKDVVFAYDARLTERAESGELSGEALARVEGGARNCLEKLVMLCEKYEQGCAGPILRKRDLEKERTAAREISVRTRAYLDAFAEKETPRGRAILNETAKALGGIFK